MFKLLTLSSMGQLRMFMQHLIILQTYFTRLDGLIWQRGDDLICVYELIVTENAPQYLMIVPASTSAYRTRQNMRNSLDVSRILNRTGDLVFSNSGTLELP